MKLNLSTLLITSFILSSSPASACTSAQLIDYDYQASELLGSSYVTFGRL